MTYWKHILTGEIVEQDTYPGYGWVEVFCTCTDSLHAGEFSDCPVHGGAK